MRTLLVRELVLVLLLVGSHAAEPPSTAGQPPSTANATEFEAPGCSKTEGQCTCKLAGMTEASQYQELLAMKKQMKEVLGELERMEAYKLLQEMSALAASVQSVKSDLETKEISISVAKIAELHANISQLIQMTSSLQVNATTQRVTWVKNMAERLLSKVGTMLKRNAHGSMEKMQHDMVLLRDQLSTCKDTFRDPDATFFRGDKLALGEVPNMCETHEFDGFGDPVSHAYYGYQGTWFKDPFPPAEVNRTEIFKSKFSSIRGVDLEQMTYKQFIGKKIVGNVFSDPYEKGSGMMIYKDILFHSHNTESYVYVRYPYPGNFIGKPIRLTMSFTRYQGDPSDTYITYHPDYDGLYIITSDVNRRLKVVKLAINTSTASYPNITVARDWVIEKPKESVCAAFIICGKLYALDDCGVLADRLGYKSIFAYDLSSKGSEGEYVKIRTLVAPFERIQQITYNPREMMFFAWDSGHALTIPVKWRPKKDKKTNTFD